MKNDNIVIILSVIITIILTVVSFALVATVNNINYGDWTCMFKKCVVVRGME